MEIIFFTSRLFQFFKRHRTFLNLFVSQIMPEQVNYKYIGQPLRWRKFQLLFLIILLFLLKKMQKHQEAIELVWDWTPVNNVLYKKNKEGQKPVSQSLSPSISLTNPLQGDDSTVKLFIDTERPFNYCNEYGWTWHKSWCMPDLSARLEVKNQKTGKQLLTPQNIYCEIVCIKKETIEDFKNFQIEDEKTNYQFRDTGIKGQNIEKMDEGQAYFTGLKFETTSHVNDETPLHLLVIIYIKERSNDTPKILTAVLSPGIFVISRRECLSKDSWNNTILFKVANIDCYSEKQIENEISTKNNIDDFYSHCLKMHNFPSESRHPILLSIMFSKFMKIFYAKNKFQQKFKSVENQTDLLGETLIVFQKIILQESNNFLFGKCPQQLLNQEQNMKINEKNEDQSQVIFVLCLTGIEDYQIREEIMRIFYVAQSYQFKIMYIEDVTNSELISENKQFLHINETDLLRTYRKYYTVLEQIFRMRLQEQISEEMTLFDQPARDIQEKRQIQIQKMEQKIDKNRKQCQNLDRLKNDHKAEDMRDKMKARRSERRRKRKVRYIENNSQTEEQEEQYVVELNESLQRSRQRNRQRKNKNGKKQSLQNISRNNLNGMQQIRRQANRENIKQKNNFQTAINNNKQKYINHGMDVQDHKAHNSQPENNREFPTSAPDKHIRNNDLQKSNYMGSQMNSGEMNDIKNNMKNRNEGININAKGIDNFNNINSPRTNLNSLGQLDHLSWLVQSNNNFNSMGSHNNFNDKNLITLNFLNQINSLNNSKNNNTSTNLQSPNSFQITDNINPQVLTTSSNNENSRIMQASKLEKSFQRILWNNLMLSSWIKQIKNPPKHFNNYNPMFKNQIYNQVMLGQQLLAEISQQNQLLAHSMNQLLAKGNNSRSKGSSSPNNSDDNGKQCRS